MSGQKNLKEDLQYTDLMPVIDNDNRGEYVKILNELLNNNNVKNIALSGPHGSGKSSIINTYLAKYPKTKAIKLSLANFAGKEEGGVDDKVELKLLEQFFYKVDSAKIPQSRYRKIKKKY